MKEHPPTERAAEGRSGSSCADYNALGRCRQPVALAICKPGRGSGGDGWCTVAKVTLLDGRPVLAVAWRSQRGTEQAVSMPEMVLEYARQAGCKHFYLRDDRTRRMWTCSLDTFRRGRLQADGERYIPLTWLHETPWRDWPYAEQVVRLGDEQHADRPGQLPLFAVARG